jgi:hypothetical protein
MDDDGGPVVRNISEARFAIEGQEGEYNRTLGRLRLYVRQIGAVCTDLKPEQDRLYPRLSGEAVIEGLGLSVAGKEDTATNSLSFSIYCEDDPAYQQHQKDAAHMEQGENESRKLVEQFEDKISASLYYMNSDWELGIDAQFGCEFALKKPEFDHLIETIKEGRLEHLSFLLTFSAIYVIAGDEHALPRELIGWYLKPEEFGSTVYGTVDGFHMHESPMRFELSEYQRDSVRWVSGKEDEFSHLVAPDKAEEQIETGSESSEAEQTQLLGMIYENTKTRSSSWMTAGVWIAIVMSFVAILKS